MMPTPEQTEAAEVLEALVDDLAAFANGIVASTIGDLDGTSGPALATYAARLQDIAASIRTASDHLTARLGRRHGAGVMDLLDGRQATLKRTSERKEWDHDEWKRDARREVAKRVAADVAITGEDGEDGILVDTMTGEELSVGELLQRAMLAIQDVHGSSPPKSTALKPLGLYASDYCTSSPAGWRLTTVRADPTTTPKD